MYKEILHHWEELFGERRKLLPRGSRSAIWDIIATKMNARSGSPVIRGGEDVRKKWCHLRKQKLHEEPVQEQPGEGGTAEDDLYLLKQRILSRMEQDAAEGKTGTIASECPHLLFVFVSLCDVSVICRRCNPKPKKFQLLYDFQVMVYDGLYPAILYCSFTVEYSTLVLTFDGFGLTVERSSKLIPLTWNVRL